MIEEQEFVKRNEPIPMADPDDNLQRIREKEAEISSLLSTARSQAEELIGAARRAAQERIEGAEALADEEAARLEERILGEAERDAAEAARDCDLELTALTASVERTRGAAVERIRECVLGL